MSILVHILARDTGKSIVDQDRVPSAVHDAVIWNGFVLRKKHDLHGVVADDWYFENLEETIQ